MPEDHQKRLASWAAYRARNRERRRAQSAAWWKENGAAYRKENREALKASQAKWRATHPVEAHDRPAQWRANNPEKQRKSEVEYRRNYPDRRRKSCAAYRAKPAIAEREKITHAKWAAKNKDLLAAKAAMRRAKKKMATPAWISDEEIRPIYLAAAMLSRETGQKYHVDHIVPLASKIVCGLHVPWNLQIMPGRENLSKGNKFWPDMP